MTVGRMLREMTMCEFAMWRIRYGEQPWGEERGDFRVAQLCALTANINRDDKKRSDPFTALDFMPYRDMPPEKEPEDIVRPETRDWFYKVSILKETDAN